MSKNELEWGQTPFDECTREELIQHCARLYSATSALSSAAPDGSRQEPFLDSRKRS
nr:Hypothetical protein [Pseudomonas aeruginosa]